MTRELYIIYLVLKNYGKSPVVEIIKTVVVGALSVLSEVAGLTEREFENIVKTVVAEMRVMCFKMEFSEWESIKTDIQIVTSNESMLYMTGSKTEESPTSPTSPISPTSTTSRTSTETECERTSERTTNRNRTTKRESNRKKRNRGVSKDDVKIPGREGKIKRIKELLEDKRTREKKSIEQYIENNEGGNREWLQIIKQANLRKTAEKEYREKTAEIASKNEKLAKKKKPLIAPLPPLEEYIKAQPWYEKIKEEIPNKLKEIRPSGKYNGYYVEIAERRLIRELLKIEDEAIIEYEKELKEQLKEEGELTEEEPQMEEEITEEDAEWPYGPPNLPEHLREKANITIDQLPGHIEDPLIIDHTNWVLGEIVLKTPIEETEYYKENREIYQEIQEELAPLLEMSENLIQGKIAAVERPERPELTDEEEEQADKEYLEDMKTYWKGEYGITDQTDRKSRNYREYMHEMINLGFSVEEIEGPDSEEIVEPKKMTRAEAKHAEEEAYRKQDEAAYKYYLEECKSYFKAKYGITSVESANYGQYEVEMINLGYKKEEIM